MPIIFDQGVSGAGYLFGDSYLRDIYADFKLGAAAKVRQIAGESLLKVPIDDAVAHATNEFIFEAPVFTGPPTQEPYSEIKVQVQDYGRSLLVDGFQYSVSIPFKGSADAFRYAPSTTTTDQPYGRVIGNKLHLYVRGYSLTKDEVQRDFDEQIANIERYIGSFAQDAIALTTNLIAETKKLVEQRRSKLLDAKLIAASLKFPMTRAQTPTALHVLKRRNLAPMKAAAANSKSFEPEYEIELKEYHHILKIIDDMSVVVERNPAAFQKIEEEHLRDFYLFVLNGHYEGQATGETFNTAGKTDILVRVENRNVFIAELKIWRGEKSATDAINQLLNYLNWRDTKACLVIFNRNANFTAMLASLKTAVTGHAQRKAGPTDVGERRFEYVFASPNDPAREILLTVLAFDVAPPKTK